MKSLIVAAALALALSAAGAKAGDLADAAAQAEQLIAAGKFTNALATLDAAKDKVWQQAPLSFGKVLFVASEPQGFGIYDVRDSSIFKKSSPLIIYAEPVGYGFGRDGDLYVIDLGLDFQITKADGTEVAKQENFGSLTLRSRVPNKEFMAKVTYDFSGLAAGDYEVTTTAHDKSSGKSGTFALKFTLTD